MKLNGYQKDANQFCSPTFFGDGVDPTQLTLALSEAAIHCAKLDAYKRSLFYDDRSKYGLNQDSKMVLDDQKEIDILHAILGIVTEAGELAEGFITTGDKVNLKEEGGDLLWYIALLCRGLDISMADMAAVNILKLDARYPGKVFTTEAAKNRVISNERQILEAVLPT